MYKIVFLTLLIPAICLAEFDGRKEVISLMEKAGMEKFLSAPVNISINEKGFLSITDEGIFVVQHTILTPAASCEPNVIINEGIKPDPNANNLVIITHGWLDGAKNNWPNDLASEIYNRIDPNKWVCALYDWKGGSVVITSIEAAEYARDIAGPRLAAAVLKLNRKFKHIHLIGHSAGSWTIHSAARLIAAANPQIQFHLTFLDAYIPKKWDEDLLGHIFDDSQKQKKQCWSDHYYTKDITYKVTQYDLKYAHNVDITAVDPFIPDHEFPYRWYFATVKGNFQRFDEKKRKVIFIFEDVDYGFARSLESGSENWQKSIKLKQNNKAVILKAPAKK